MSRRISAAIGASLATARSASAGLKVENCAPPNSLQHLGLGDVGERRVDADQIVGLGPRLQRLLVAGSGSGSVFALRIFCAIVSASSVRLMRE